MILGPFVQPSVGFFRVGLFSLLSSFMSLCCCTYRMQSWSLELSQPRCLRPYCRGWRTGGNGQTQKGDML